MICAGIQGTTSPNSSTGIRFGLYFFMTDSLLSLMCLSYQCWQINAFVNYRSGHLRWHVWLRVGSSYLVIQTICPPEPCHWTLCQRVLYSGQGRQLLFFNFFFEIQYLKLSCMVFKFFFNDEIQYEAVNFSIDLLIINLWMWMHPSRPLYHTIHQVMF